MCHDEILNDLIFNAKFIISAPSTVTLRSLFLNKHTIILNDKYYGQLGNLRNFKGLIDKFDINLIIEKLKYFDINKNYIKEFLQENYFV